jgi:NAD(P)-dependent dehydrogenase (short-subunit alcohol dehydrogenase family)
MSSVLVTGASRGIGRSIAEELAGHGWDVIAGVRTQQDADTLTAVNPQRISAVILDVTSDDDLAQLEATLPADLDAVVNNAGIVVSGPMETLSNDEWRRQLEVNVIGTLAVTRAVLPRLRQSKGRIVFISSISGRVSAPIVGAYSASKFALEAAADAMRMELRPWGVSVVLVEPAQTDTDLWRQADSVAAELEQALSAEHRALYAKHILGFKKSIPLSQRLAVAAERVSAVVEQALTAKRPRARYVVGVGPRLQVALVTKLPARVRDFALRKMYRQP